MKKIVAIVASGVEPEALIQRQNVSGDGRGGPVMLTKLNPDIWRRALARLATVFGATATIVLGVIVTFAWMVLLAHGFAALISWAI